MLKLTNTHGGCGITLDLSHHLTIGGSGLGVGTLKSSLLGFLDLGSDQTTENIILVVMLSAENYYLIGDDVQGYSHGAVLLLTGVK